MTFKSEFVETDFGVLHYKIVTDPDPDNPALFFFHGGSLKSQHTQHWLPVIDVITEHCNPVLVDRYGHGQSKASEKVGVRDHVESLVELVQHISINDYSKKFGFVGRSAGAGFILRMLPFLDEMIDTLGFIAPGSLKSNINRFETIGQPITLLWDTRDPVVKFENYQLLVEHNIAHSLFVISDQPIDAFKRVGTEGIKASHMPEILAPALFGAFLEKLCSDM